MLYPVITSYINCRHWTRFTSSSYRIYWKIEYIKKVLKLNTVFTIKDINRRKLYRKLRFTALVITFLMVIILSLFLHAQLVYYELKRYSTNEAII